MATAISSVWYEPGVVESSIFGTGCRALVLVAFFKREHLAVFLPII